MKTSFLLSLTQNFSFVITENTASAFLDHSTSDCFQFVVASPQNSISNGSYLDTSTPENCQSICRNTYGCKVFQWMPKIFYVTE